MHKISLGFLIEIASWFVGYKSPELAGPLLSCVQKAPHQWNEQERKLIGFVLFSYSMNRGPTSWVMVKELAADAGIIPEFEFYANDWISHSQTPGK